MTRKAYTRKVRILGEHTDFKKQGGKYPAAVFSQFKNRPIFYIIRPPDCVKGYKLGRAADGESRLKAYQHKYGKGFDIIFVLTLARRTSTETGESSQVYFEKLVKRELKGKSMSGRGTEFYPTESVIIKAVDRVRKSFEGKMDAQVGTRRVSERIKKKEIPVPEIGDKVLFIWDHTGKTKRLGAKPYKATITRHVPAKRKGGKSRVWELKFSDGRKYKITLPKSKFSNSPSATTPGEWKII